MSADWVERQLVARGISDQRVLAAMRAVPREEFVAPVLEPRAYEDRPLPIGAQQTISQPFVVALMAEALELMPEDRVLEVGAGSGYAAAVLARLAREVWTLERHASLAEGAHTRLQRLGFHNVHVVHGDGSLGWPDEAPYQAITAAAAAPRIPSTLVEQLAVGGRLVLPVGTADHQDLLRLRRREDGTILQENLGPVRFVPLVGERGFRAPEG